MFDLKKWLSSDIGSRKIQHPFDDMVQSSDAYSNWDDKDGTVDAQIEEERERTVSRKILFIALCTVAIFVAMGLIISYGEYELGFWEVYGILWNHICNGVPTDPIEYLRDYVVWSLRLPRVVVGAVAGFGLAVAGAVMQSTLKNPMADSYTTGVSSGAVFGATLAAVAGITLFSSDFGLLLNSFLFSLMPTFAIILIARMRKVNATSMILAGLAIMYIFNACTAMLKLWAEPDALASLYRWQVGSLNNMLWSDVPVMLVTTALGTVVLLLFARHINILSSGDENAKSLGIDAQKLRVLCLLIASLITASIVSFTGTIGFVGLVAPHITRIFIGSDNRFLIPAAGMFGGLLMIVSDIIGRTIMAPSVLEVGVVTAFIGGPMFLYLIIRQRKGAW